MPFRRLVIFRNTSRVSNRLNPDQERCSIGPDLDPNRLKRLTADENKSPLAGIELMIIYYDLALLSKDKKKFGYAPHKNVQNSLHWRSSHLRSYARA